jgi:hypothetical protein
VERPTRETIEGWTAEMAEQMAKGKTEMKERSKRYERLGCWSADGAVMPMVSMSFWVGEAEARAIVQAALIAPSLPAGSSVALTRLLDATTSHFQESGYKSGAADAEVEADHFAVRAGKMTCGRQPVAPLAAFFGIEWREGDEEWWGRHVPPGWRLVGHRGREAARLEDPSGRPVDADAKLLGDLLAWASRPEAAA